MELPARRHGRLALALLLALPTLLFADVWFGGRSFHSNGGDLMLYHYPMKRVVREAMLSGEFPYWQRLLGVGQPLAANPAWELFYPPQWLVTVGDYRFGFALHILVHVYAALVGTWLLLRAMRLGHAAAVFGAVSYGLGGFLLGAMPTLPTFFVWALAPLAAWSVLRVLQDPAPARFAAAVAICGVQLLVAEPMATAQVWLILLVLALLFPLRPSAPAARRVTHSIALVAGIGLGAVAFAAVQLLPGVDHARDSVRSRGLPWETVRDYSMPFMRPLQMVVPDLYGSQQGAGAYWGSSQFIRQKPYFASIYCGIFVAIFALAGILARSPGWQAFVPLSLLSFALAIGDRLPLLRLFYDAGLASWVRYPEKLSALVILPGVVYAASTADRFLAGAERERGTVRIAAVATLALAAGLALLTFVPSYPALFARFWRLTPQDVALAAIARRAWIIGFAITAAAAALLLWRRRVTPLWITLAALVLLVDITRAANGLTPRGDREYFTPPPAAAYFESDRSAYRLFHLGEWMHTPERGIYREISTRWLARNGLIPLTPAAWGLRSALELDYDETALLPTHEMLDAMRTLGNSGFARWAAPFATMSNVRYVLTYRDPSLDAAHAQGELSRSRPVDVLRVREQPTYFFATRMVVAEDLAHTLDFLRTDPEPFGVAIVSSPRFTSGSARVLRAEETANTATLDVDAAAPAFLVATVTRHKYWRAFVDGAEAPLVPANIAYQGLPVPTGRHRIEMRYSNPLVTTGAVISGLALLGCALAAATALTRRRPLPRNGS